MTWIEKRAAAALFGAPPEATYEEALQHFLNSGKEPLYEGCFDSMSAKSWLWAW